MERPDIRGEVRTDDATLDRYSVDWSRYTLRPMMVTLPEDSADVRGIVDFAREHALPVTPRGAGSNQSGSAVGEGVIVLFSRMNGILSLDGTKVRVQPGVIYDTLDREMRKLGLRVSYSPTSRAFCTIGGNVGTRAGGIRSIKYGTVNEVIRTVRFVDPVHGLVDTGRPLPFDLEQVILGLKERITADAKARAVLSARKNLKSSSGYNIGAFLRYDTAAEIVTHLQAGAVGTLGVLTEVELELLPLPGRTILFLIYYPSLIDAVSEVPALLPLGPSALELMDSHGLGRLCEQGGQVCPEGSSAVLMVEFDEDIEQSELRMRRLLGGRHEWYGMVTDPALQERLWEVRESMLLRIRREMETPEAKFPAFADDLGVPPERLPLFLEELQDILKETGTEAFIYGHAGEGNLHVRPMIKKDHWEETMKNLADRVFRAALRCGGTLTGEHGAGRNRSRYLAQEWGEPIYSYFQEIKQVFDPGGILNPGVMFTTDEVTKNLQF